MPWFRGAAKRFRIPQGVQLRVIHGRALCKIKEILVSFITEHTWRNTEYMTRSNVMSRTARFSCGCNECHCLLHSCHIECKFHTTLSQVKTHQTSNFILHSAHYKLNTTNSTLHTTNSTLHTKHFTMNTRNCTLPPGCCWPLWRESGPRDGN